MVVNAMTDWLGVKIDWLCVTGSWASIFGLIATVWLAVWAWSKSQDLKTRLLLPTYSKELIALYLQVEAMSVQELNGDKGIEPLSLLGGILERVEGLRGVNYKKEVALIRSQQSVLTSSRSNLMLKRAIKDLLTKIELDEIERQEKAI